MINVLMTGAGAPGAPGIIRCFKQDRNINLIVCDANEHASGRYLNKVFELVPMASESNFIESILYLCEKYKIDVVFPLVTRELFLFSEYKEDFKNKGIEVLVSDLTSLNIANNKSALYCHLEKTLYQLCVLKWLIHSQIYKQRLTAWAFLTTLFVLSLPSQMVVEVYVLLIIRSTNMNYCLIISQILCI